MSMEETEITATVQDHGWKARTLIVGGVVGALVGVAGAFLLVKRAEQQGKPLSISTGKGMQLGMLIAGMLRSLLSLGDN